MVHVIYSQCLPMDEVNCSLELVLSLPVGCKCWYLNGKVCLLLIHIFDHMNPTSNSG